MKEYTESGYSFIQLVIKRKIHFIVMTVASIVFASVFSSEWFIAPKYKSFAVVYPINIIPYGEESASEQLLQLFNSGDVRTAVINKFDLYNHYGIDSTEKNALANIIAEYASNVEISRTQFESVNIEVLDKDPILAAEMVNEIIRFMNLKARALQVEKSKELEIVVQNQLAFKKKTIDSINDRLHELRVRYQLFDYDIQVKEVTKSYLKAISSGGKNLKEIDVMMRNLEEKGGEYYQLSNSLESLLKSYNKTRIEDDLLQRDIRKELSYASVVTKSMPSYQKSYPIRWLIVLASVLSANLFLFILFVILENRNK